MEEVHVDSNKKRRFEDVGGSSLGESQLPQNDPMPFTCICFEGKFYTTDNEGYFIHNVLQDESRMVPLYRCEVTPSKDVIFVLIRHLNETEVQFLETTDDLNCLTDLSKNNRSLFY